MLGVLADTLYGEVLAIDIIEDHLRNNSALFGHSTLWCRVRDCARLGVLVSRLRMILDETLARKVDEPKFDMGSSEVVGIVRRLVELDGLER